MKILVLNCGSSSIKYQLFGMPGRQILAKGLADRIGLPGSTIRHKRLDEEESRREIALPDHRRGIEIILDKLTGSETGVIRSLGEIEAAGHRVVHAGEFFNGSVRITPEVIKALEDSIELAPLHNPPNLQGIYTVSSLLPGLPQVGVFDTAFHQTLPPYSYLYGLPYEFYERFRIRKYGFHGTSHRYVCRRACEILKVDEKNTRIISCHLGNGSSIAAVKNGHSLDTSMGLTPTEGLLMGTRCGDLDPGALLYLMRREKLSVDDADKLLNKQSGVLGISGVSSDMREVEAEAEKNNPRARLALDMFHYRVKKYIGAYAAAMGGVDILVFTGGIGENAWKSRAAVCEGLEFLGLEFDAEKNKGSRGKEVLLSGGQSAVKVMVVPTNEELVIASDTYDILSGRSELSY
jgi:acetate kinase